MIASYTQFDVETFGLKDWLCPDTSQIEISAGAEFTTGKNFYMVVNTCENAKQIE